MALPAGRYGLTKELLIKLKEMVGLSPDNIGNGLSLANSKLSVNVGFGLSFDASGKLITNITPTSTLEIKSCTHSGDDRPTPGVFHLQDGDYPKFICLLSIRGVGQSIANYIACADAVGLQPGSYDANTIPVFFGGISSPSVELSQVSFGDGYVYFNGNSVDASLNKSGIDYTLYYLIDTSKGGVTDGITSRSIWGHHRSVKKNKKSS